MTCLKDMELYELNTDFNMVVEIDIIGFIDMIKNNEVDNFHNIFTTKEEAEQALNERRK